MNLKMILSWYNVTDLAAASKFYGDTLGLKKIFEMPGWVEFAEGPDMPAVGLREDAKWEPGGTVVFRVENVDAARREMESRGVKFVGPTEEIPGAVRLAMFTDPAGNKLQLAQPLLKQ
jgi:predicted enzyme related to lactoylglutathione lyase